MAFEELKDKNVRNFYHLYMTQKYGDGYTDLEFNAADIMHGMATCLIGFMDGVKTAYRHKETMKCVRELQGEARMIVDALDKAEFGDYGNN